MTSLRGFILGLVCLVASSGGQAQWYWDYHEFRHISGLPGGGYGVSPEGKLDFGGTLQLNIPVGYTPGAGQAAVSLHSMATSGGVRLGLGNSGDTDGTLTLGWGMSLGGHEVWVADMETAEKWESSYNVQVQVASPRGRRPGLAVGVVDLLNQRPATVARPFAGEARSLYVAATHRTGAPDHPVYWTTGIGSGRFRSRLFAGVSYQASRRVKLVAEYDSWNVNVGTAYRAPLSRELDLTVLLGLIDLKNALAGATVTYSSSDKVKAPPATAGQVSPPALADNVDLAQPRMADSPLERPAGRWVPQELKARQRWLQSTAVGR